MAKPPQLSLTKRVLQAEWRARRESAWQLLFAVRDLFPERINELASITRGLDPATVKATV
jgi:hypothetical protein